MQKLELNEKNLKECAIQTITEIWNCIDWDKWDTQRLYGIWDEVNAKVKACANSTNSYETFVEKLTKKIGVRSLKFSGISEISQQDSEFKEKLLEIFREQTQIILLEVRLNKERAREEKELKEDK